jgi:peptidoglycan/LPS O-acetylase OafA/YrhL
MNNQERAHFDVLDGMRGIAAVAVMLFHYMSDFGLAGWMHNDTIAPFRCGPLAVDFFFMLSGFVLTGAYSPMLLRGVSVGRFFAKRALRLYPMYAIGMACGLLALVLTTQFNPDGTLDWSDLTASLVPSLVMIPDYIGHHGLILGSSSLEGAAFPLDPPGWSLFYELYAGIMLVFLVRRSNRVLIAILALSFLTLLAATPISALILHQPMHVFFFAGGGRKDLWVGLSRMVTSFVAGIVLWRWRATGRLERGAMAWPVGAPLAYAVLIGSLLMPVTLKGLWPTLFLVGVAPLLIIWGARIAPGPGAIQRLSRALGWISFPLYCVHYPVGQIAWVLCRSWHLSLWTAFAGGSLLSIMVAALTCRFIEEPIRRRLAQPRQPAVQALG